MRGRRDRQVGCELEHYGVTWLTLRRTYSSWAHQRGVPAKVVAQLMGHAKIDTTLNVYTQVIDGALRAAVDQVGSELFTIVHKSAETTELTH
jgi:integrase